MENLINHSIEFFNFCDTALLLGLNGHHTVFLDCVMDIVSMRLVWAPLYIILLTMVWRRYGWRGAAVCLLTTIMAVTLVDQVCGSVLRGMVGRMRPSNPDNPLSAWIQIVDGYRGGKYGFPSCHAANTALVAVYLSLWLRSKALFAALCAWCLLVSLSRVYLGVHYPSDILAGMTIGGGVAYGFYKLLHLCKPVYPAFLLRIMRLKW